MDLCMYPSKPCANPRSVKSNDQLHRFCSYHRAKANDSQRRWQFRHRPAAAEGHWGDYLEDWVSEVPRTKQRRNRGSNNHNLLVARPHIPPLELRQPATSLQLPEPRIASDEFVEPWDTGTGQGNMESLSDEEISTLLESIFDASARTFCESDFPHA